MNNHLLKKPDDSKYSLGTDEKHRKDYKDPPLAPATGLPLPTTQCKYIML